MIRLLTASVLVGQAVGCRAAPPSERPSGATPFTAQRPAACSWGRNIDSAYVVGVAAEALSPGGLADLRPVAYEAIVADGPIEEGILVRLAPHAPRLGGGGLVFVDAESGCALALRVYE